MNFEFGSVRHGYPVEEMGASDTSVRREGAVKWRRKICAYLSPQFFLNSGAIFFEADLRLPDHNDDAGRQAVESIRLHSAN